MVPRGAQPIPNPNGTAPGLIVDSPRGIIICMPGVPHELEPMMTEQVIPFLRQRFGMAGVVHYRVLKVYGIGESRVDSMIGDLIQAGENPTIGLLASPDMVRIRIAAKADSVEAAEALIAPVEQRIRERIPEGIDIVCIRELTGGVYFGQPKTTTVLPDGDIQAVDTMVYKRTEIERILQVAIATARGRKKRL